MTGEQPRNLHRSLARLVLWALGFLLVTSYLAVPCLVNDHAAFVASDAATCETAHVFRPNAPLPEVFGASLPAEGLRFALPAPLVLAAAVLAAVPASVLARLRKRRPWRTAALPFVTSDPPHLPAFAAQRDA